MMELGKTKRRSIWDYKMEEKVIIRGRRKKDLGVAIYDTPRLE